MWSNKVNPTNRNLLVTALNSGTYTPGSVGQRLMRAIPSGTDLWTPCGVACEIMRLNVPISGGEVIHWALDTTNSAMTNAGAYRCYYGNYLLGGSHSTWTADYYCWAMPPGIMKWFYGFSGPVIQEMYDRFTNQNQSFATIAIWLNGLP